MIDVNASTALVLYLFAYLGLVLICWWRYEVRRNRKHSNAKISEVTEEDHGHVDRAES